MVDYALEGAIAATIYDGDRLVPGMAFAGPAIIEDAGTTSGHPSRQRASPIDAFGNLHITLSA